MKLFQIASPSVVCATLPVACDATDVKLDFDINSP